MKGDAKMIITIGRQFCSGGSEIGRKLSERLGIPYYDKNLYEYANAKAKTEVSDYDIMKQYKTVTNWERRGKSAVIYYISKAIN